jgi:hypothetical protein
MYQALRAGAEAAAAEAAEAAERLRERLRACQREARAAQEHAAAAAAARRRRADEAAAALQARGVPVGAALTRPSAARGGAAMTC